MDQKTPAALLAAQTPADIREAMLLGSQTVAGLTIHPLSLNILWMLEDCGHPLAVPGAEASPESFDTRRVAEMVFAFAEPAIALRAAKQMPAPGERFSSFTSAALDFASKVPAQDLRAVAAAVAKVLQVTLATAPGGGENPPPAGA